jgi:hypothetical protein
LSCSTGWRNYLKIHEDLRCTNSIYFARAMWYRSIELTLTVWGSAHPSNWQKIHIYINLLVLAPAVTRHTHFTSIKSKIYTNFKILIFSNTTGCHEHENYWQRLFKLSHANIYLKSPHSSARASS